MHLVGTGSGAVYAWLDAARLEIGCRRLLHAG
jgi:hypothetical protein